jgi:SAM-dependent methyltransferase
MMPHSLENKAEQRFVAWLNGIKQELKFWQDWFASEGDRWPEEYQRRLNPMREIDRWILGDMPNPHQAKVLDVGSGPMTNLGSALEGRKIDITACDPLAIFYAEIAEEHGVDRPVETQVGFAEELSSFFQPGTFDVIHCCNALDHSYEPMRGIEEMLIVAKPNGRIVLSHAINEAEYEQYSGLHQWNFDMQGGKFIIWNKSQRTDATTAFALYADIVVETKARWIVVILTKKAELPINLAERSRARIREILPAAMMALYRHS